jgi:hypothetical protein
MQRWEYCCLNVGELQMLSADSIKSIEIKRDKSKGDGYDWDAFLRTIAKLGLDGWEMVGNEAVNNKIILWFKRPLQQ